MFNSLKGAAQEQQIHATWVYLPSTSQSTKENLKNLFERVVKEKKNGNCGQNTIILYVDDQHNKESHGWYSQCSQYLIV